MNATSFDKKVEILDLTAEYKQTQEVQNSRLEHQQGFKSSVLLVVKFVNKLKARVKMKKELMEFINGYDSDPRLQSDQKANLQRTLIQLTSLIEEDEFSDPAKKRNSDLDKCVSQEIQPELNAFKQIKDQKSLGVIKTKQKFELNSFRDFLSRNNRLSKKEKNLKRSETKASKLYRTGSRPENVLQQDIEDEENSSFHEESLHPIFQKTESVIAPKKQQTKTSINQVSSPKGSKRPLLGLD